MDEARCLGAPQEKYVMERVIKREFGSMKLGVGASQGSSLGVGKLIFFGAAVAGGYAMWKGAFMTGAMIMVGGLLGGSLLEKSA